MDIVFRRAGPADSDFAYVTKKAAFREYVEKVWGWNEEEQRELHARRFAEQEFMVIEVDGTPAGIIALARTGECVKVNQLFVRPEHQGKGVGGESMRRIMAEARAAGLPVHLRVLKVNPRAAKFYRRLGFAGSGESETHWEMEWRPAARLSGDSFARFPLVERQLAVRMGAEVEGVTPGETRVVESERRRRGETVYPYATVLWWAWLEDGRSVLSVPPGAKEAATAVARRVRNRDELWNSEVPAELQSAMAPFSEGSDLKCRGARLVFASNGARLQPHPHGQCRRLESPDLPVADEFRLPRGCFPGGTVFGAFDGDRVVSLALAHPVGVMEEQVADVGVVTAPAYRGRGLAKAVVSALAEHTTARGGELRYVCRRDNAASIAVARALGFAPFAVDLSITRDVPARGLW